MNKPEVTLSIYGCGGTGVNLVSSIIDIPTKAAGFPNVDYTVVDTSDSNIRKVEGKNIGTYLVPGLDGSGKDRSFGFQNVESHINEVLNQFKPKDFSIVIFSLSGGSGSVIGPMLVSELTKRNKDVIAICIGSTANGKEAENTLKSIATLQNMSMKALKKPIIANMFLNSRETNRSTVDRQVEANVRALALLVSGKNHEMDSKDIHHFLQYTKVTEVPAQLVDLLVYSAHPDSEAPSGFHAISVASVLPSTDLETLDLGQPYGCVGYMPAGVVEGTQDSVYPLHFILTNSRMNERIQSIQTAIKAYDDAEEALKNTTIVQVGEAEDDSGFVF